MKNIITDSVKNDIMDNYKQTDNIFSDMCGIIEAAQKSAYNSVNIALIKRNWLIGHRIAEESLKGAGRAEYGANVISKLSKELTSNTEKDIQNLICTLSIRSIKFIRRFSRHRQENLIFCFHGHITQFFCR